MSESTFSLQFLRKNELLLQIFDTLAVLPGHLFVAVSTERSARPDDRALRQEGRTLRVRLHVTNQRIFLSSLDSSNLLLYSELVDITSLFAPPVKDAPRVDMRCKTCHVLDAVRYFLPPTPSSDVLLTLLPRGAAVRGITRAVGGARDRAVIALEQAASGHSDEVENIVAEDLQELAVRFEPTPATVPALGAGAKVFTVLVHDVTVTIPCALILLPTGIILHPLQPRETLLRPALALPWTRIAAALPRGATEVEVFPTAAAGRFRGLVPGPAAAPPTFMADVSFLFSAPRLWDGSADETLLGDPLRVVFMDAAARTTVLGALASHTRTAVPPIVVARVCAAWRDRALSTYGFILALNIIAGRSFANLDNYPCLPWPIHAEGYGCDLAPWDAPATGKTRAAYVNFATDDTPAAAARPAVRAALLACLPPRAAAETVPPYPLSVLAYRHAYPSAGSVPVWTRAPPPHSANCTLDGRLVTTLDTSIVDPAAAPATTAYAATTPPRTFPAYAPKPASFLSAHRTAIESDEVGSHLGAWVGRAFPALFSADLRPPNRARLGLSAAAAATNDVLERTVRQIAPSAYGNSMIMGMMEVNLAAVKEATAAPAPVPGPTPVTGAGAPAAAATAAPVYAFDAVDEALERASFVPEDFADAIAGLDDAEAARAGGVPLPIGIAVDSPTGTLQAAETVFAAGHDPWGVLNTDRTAISVTLLPSNANPTHVVVLMSTSEFVTIELTPDVAELSRAAAADVDRLRQAWARQRAVAAVAAAEAGAPVPGSLLADARVLAADAVAADIRGDGVFDFRAAGSWCAHLDPEAFRFTGRAVADLVLRPATAVLPLGLPGAVLVTAGVGSAAIYNYVAAAALRARLHPPIAAPPGRSAGDAAYSALQDALFAAVPEFDVHYEPTTLLPSRDARELVEVLQVASASLRTAAADGHGGFLTVGQGADGQYLASMWSTMPLPAAPSTLTLVPAATSGCPHIATSLPAADITRAALGDNLAVFGFANGAVAASSTSAPPTAPLLVHAGAVTGLCLYETDGTVMGAVSCSVDGSVGLITVSAERVTLVGRVVVGSPCTCLAVADGYIAVGTAEGRLVTIAFPGLFGDRHYGHISSFAHSVVTVSDSPVRDVAVSSNGVLLIALAGTGQPNIYLCQDNIK